MGVRTGNEAAPDFHAETHPPGTAPASKTRYPVPDSDPEVLRRAADSSAPGSGPLGDALGMPGATSGSVHNTTEYGKPVSGQTTRELRGGQGERSGLEGVGANPKERDRWVKDQGADLEGEAAAAQGTRGKSGSQRGDWPGAEDRLPESA